jgi:hypothetical protein
MGITGNDALRLHWETVDSEGKRDSDIRFLVLKDLNKLTVADVRAEYVKSGAHKNCALTAEIRDAAHGEIFPPRTAVLPATQDVWTIAKVIEEYAISSTRINGAVDLSLHCDYTAPTGIVTGWWRLRG